MTETLCTSAAVKLKAGSNVSSSLTPAQYTTLINEAEAWLSWNAKYDFVANYSSLSTNLKPILEDAASSYAAFGAIDYDTSNYTNRELEVKTDKNWNKVVEITNLLRENKWLEFIKSGTEG